MAGTQKVPAGTQIQDKGNS